MVAMQRIVDEGEHTEELAFQSVAKLMEQATKRRGER
jgi:hypothetical protein